MITVQMPYGEVELRTKMQGRRFAMNVCESCPWRCLMEPCSGARVQQCLEKVRYVIEHRDELED